MLPNILTLAGVCLGISSIKFSIDGNFSLAVTLILFAAILDALDGRIARLIKGTSEFGKELDSLTDFVSFGIAPVFFLYLCSIDFDLEKFIKMKLKLISDGNKLNKPIYFDEELNIIDEFSPISDLPGQKKYKFSIKGTPSMGRIKTIALGIKNPSTQIGKDLSGEIWFNELRLSEIAGKGGWSAIANLDANLADFANVSFSGRMSSDGFGSVDKSPNERSNENYSQYSLVTNLNAGQLFPEKWGVQLPISYTYATELTKTKYDS